jgi:uncharacterized protein YdeI (YjbR/CyaY-like superfamily)
MEINNLLHVINRKELRKWLSKNHKKEKSVWLVYYKKHTNKPRIPYDHAVEEALCYGWIDSTVKRLDDERTAQRFTPRNDKSNWSELNKERVRKLIKQNKMTPYGLEKARWLKDDENNSNELIIPKEILRELKKENITWNNFNNFPDYYKKIRLDYIGSSKKRKAEFKRRLKHFIDMTRKNKRFGMMPYNKK